MNIDFPFLLLFLSLLTGFIALADSIFCKVYRLENGTLPVIVDYAKSFFPVFVLVFLIRAFLTQPFEVPSESLEPTIKPVEMLFVNQFKYGLRLPIWNIKLMNISKLDRGDIVVFHYPVNPGTELIKRVVGLPGDTVSYINKELYINGKKIVRQFVETTETRIGSGPLFTVKQYQETMDGKTHMIYVRPDKMDNDFYNVIVPQGAYFMMGDNRDESDDSRYWGFVEDKYIVAKAEIIWWSWDRIASKARWDRIGTLL